MRSHADSICSCHAKGSRFWSTRRLSRYVAVFVLLAPAACTWPRPYSSGASRAPIVPEPEERYKVQRLECGGRVGPKDIRKLNELAADGWKVVQIVGDRDIVLER